jgi:hypothetical protein
MLIKSFYRFLTNINRELSLPFNQFQKKNIELPSHSIESQPHHHQLKSAKMCWWEHPSPVYFSKCKHRVNVPTETTPHMCPVAYDRTPQTWCDPMQNTSKGSSTNRRDFCPDCRNKGPDYKKYGDDNGTGAGGSSYSVQYGSVRVGA